LLQLITAATSLPIRDLLRHYSTAASSARPNKPVATRTGQHLTSTLIAACPPGAKQAAGTNSQLAGQAHDERGGYEARFARQRGRVDLFEEPGGDSLA